MGKRGKVSHVTCFGGHGLTGEIWCVPLASPTHYYGKLVMFLVMYSQTAVNGPFGVITAGTAPLDWWKTVILHHLKSGL